MPRYSLLLHTDAPNDPLGTHIDLLLEDAENCRTWRIPQLPHAGGASQEAVPLPPHRLLWLEPRSAAVSGNRGWAERLCSGHYSGVLPDEVTAAVNVILSGDLEGRLQINKGRCRLSNP